MENKKRNIATDIEPGNLIRAAVRIPSVRVDREKYLRGQFDKVFDEYMVTKILELGPHAAGVPKEDIASLSKSTIRHETTIVSLLSGTAGVPGGWAMAATIPADVAQFNGALLRVAQKLAYLHDWPELVPERPENIDENTKNILIIFVGSMYGLKLANEGISFIAGSFSKKVVTIINAKPLTKTTMYPLIKKISLALGIQFNKQVAGQVASKTVPVIGAVISGGLTFITFRGMATRLHKHLSSQQVLKARNNRKPNENF